MLDSYIMAGVVGQKMPLRSVEHLLFINNTLSEWEKYEALQKLRIAAMSNKQELSIWDLIQLLGEKIVKAILGDLI